MGISLLMMLVGGMFLSAWVSLMSTRAAQLSLWEQATERRIDLEGSRLLARQVAWENSFQPSATLESGVAGTLGGVLTPGLGIGVDSGDGWVGLNVLASTDSPDNLTTVFPFNATSPNPLPSFVTIERLLRPSTLVDVDPFNAYLFLKSRPTPLVGDLFVAYRKPAAATSELDVHADTSGHHAIWRVEGRAVIRHPLSLFARSTPSPLRLPFQSQALHIQSHDPGNFKPIYGTNLSGGRMGPSNLPVVPSTAAGNAASASERFAGDLDVVQNDANPTNSLWHFMQREQTEGRGSFESIEVYTDTGAAGDPWWMEQQSDPTYPPPNWPSGYPPKLRVLFVQLNHPNLPHLRVLGVVDQVVFVGQSNYGQFQDASALPPVMMAVVPNGATGPTVRDVRFVADNNRNLVLGLKHWNAAPLDISWEGNPTSGFQHRWRCFLINEFQTVMLNMPANVTRTVRWLGGVMTNWTFKRRAAGGRNASRLVFAPEWDPTIPVRDATGPDITTLIPRDAWLESYFLPGTP
jgi:hypothetical protein